MSDDTLPHHIDQNLAKLLPGVGKDALYHYLAHALDTHNCFAITDPDGKIIYANDHLRATSQFTETQTPDPRNGINLIVGDLDPATLETLWTKIRAGNIWTGTVVNNTQNHTAHWGESTIIPIADAAKKIHGYIGLRTDITRLKRAEAENTRIALRYAAQSERLRNAQTQVQLLFEHAPIGLAWREMLPDGRYGDNHANARFSELSGLTLEQLNNPENVRKVTPPDDWQKQCALQAKIDSGETNTYTLDKRYIHADGRIVWTTLIVIVLRDTDGRITNHFTMLKDITDRHAADIELRATEARWRTYLQTATDTLYTIAPDGTYKFISASVTDRLGYTPDELTGQHYLDLIHPRDRETFNEYYQNILHGKLKPGSAIEYRIRHKNGEYIWHASSASPYNDRYGQRAFLGIDRDISIRKKAQDELKIALTQREELERIINRSQTIIILWKAEPGWPAEFVSKSIRQFGYEPTLFTTRQKNYNTIIHPDDRERIFTEIEAHAAKGDRDYIQEYRITCHDGTIRWVEDHTVVRRDPAGNISHHEGLITDITERKEAKDRERRQQERALRQAAEVQTHLSPHDFPDINEIEVEALSQPSTHIGGDYYDVIRVDDQHWGFVIADVAGKGPGAALMMASCRAALRLCANRQLSPAEVVKKVNRFLHADMPHGMFISLFYGILNLKTHRLRYIRAGHEPPILLRRNATDDTLLTADGLAIGLDDGPIFDTLITEDEITLAAGDLLALYTDGITEATDARGEEFGRDRFIGTLSRHSDTPLKTTIDNITKHLAQYATLATRTDDRTLLLIRPR